MGLDFLVPIFGILIVLVPVTGLTVILTARFASRPIAEALSHLRVGPAHPSPDLELQVRDLTETVETLTHEVRRLREAQDFDRKLLEKAGAGESGT